MLTDEKMGELFREYLEDSLPTSEMRATTMSKLRSHVTVMNTLGSISPEIRQAMMAADRRGLDTKTEDEELNSKTIHDVPDLKT